MKNKYRLKVTFLFLLSFLYSFGQQDTDFSFSEEVSIVAQADSTAAYILNAEDSTIVVADLDEDDELPRDTFLTYNPESIDYLKSNTHYGPGQKMKKFEKGKKSKDEKSRFLSEIVEFIESINGEIFIIALIIFIVCIIFISLFVFYKNHYYHKKYGDSGLKKTENEQVETVDLLNQALQSKNYNEAVKIVYVQTLAWLNNHQMIHWELSKTPSEYYYEVKDHSLRKPFKELTHIFLLARYDNVMVDCEMYESAQKYKQQILSMTK